MAKQLGGKTTFSYVVVGSSQSILAAKRIRFLPRQRIQGRLSPRSRHTSECTFQYLQLVFPQVFLEPKLLPVLGWTKTVFLRGMIVTISSWAANIF